MISFSEYMRDLASRNKLRVSIDGVYKSYRMVMPRGTFITARCHDLDDAADSFLFCEPWAFPLSPLQAQAFLRAVLNFNRNALTHLPAGILQDESNSRLYRLQWRIASAPQGSDLWAKQLALFEKLYLSFKLPQQHAPQQSGGHMIFMP
jgi:hypothetical protein